MSDFLELTVGKFTFKVAGDRLYNIEGVWAKEEHGLVRTGLSDFLQQRSGDVAFCEVKPAGTNLAVNDEIATIETIKVDIALSSPVSGTVTRINPRLVTAPETINLDPYEEGWLCEIQASDWQAARVALLSPEAYYQKIKRESEAEIK